MELSVKTTILFPPELHKRLVELAKQRGVSLGYLVRTACEARYSRRSTRKAVAAVDELRRLSLPVGDVADMKKESTPNPEDLLP